LDQAGFEMGMPHKNRDVIIAWANGEAIQVKPRGGEEWIDWPDYMLDPTTPPFGSLCKFRIKPKEEEV
jgi:hypothetical protein